MNIFEFHVTYVKKFLKILYLEKSFFYKLIFFENKKCLNKNRKGKKVQFLYFTQK